MWSMAVLTNVLGLAVGAGLNLYAAVLVTGLGIRYGWLGQLPADMQVLGHPVVLGVAGVMYAAEFVADKVPFFTPIWDGIHTFIRPVGGALLALGATGDMDPMVRTLAMLAAGTVALGTHTSKMGVRLMAHTTPEPATHSVLSVAEDVTVVALLALGFQYPWVALPVLLAMLGAMLVLLPFLGRVAVFLVAGLWGRVTSALGEGRADASVFSRKVKGVPRLKRGSLEFTGEFGRFRYRSWGREKVVEVGALEGAPRWGFVYNVVVCGSASFYATKEWATSRRPGGASTQRPEYR